MSVQLFEKLPWNRGMVLLHPDFEATGTVAQDISLYHNNGIFLAAGEPTWVQLISGVWVLSFDGVNDKVSIGNPVSLRLSAPITVSLWCNPTAAHGGNNHYLLSKGDALTDGYHILLRDDNTWTAFFGTATVVGPAPIVGTWKNLVITDNGAALIFYVNGAFFATAAGAPVVNATKSLLLGKYSSGDNLPFQGYEGERRIYPRALPADEIALLFIQSKGDYGL